MTITYFNDTNTLFVNFNNNPVERTVDFSENILMDMDKDGNIVNITIEHANQRVNISNFSYNQLPVKMAV